MKEINMPFLIMEIYKQDGDTTLSEVFRTESLSEAFREAHVRNRVSACADPSFSYRVIKGARL